MHWEDERYVRLYTRDSTTWLKWTWEARATFALLLRKVDRSGRLPLDGETPADAVALHTGLPAHVVESGLAQITKPDKNGTPTAKVDGDALVLPNFEPAQTTRSSDAKRSKDYRDNKRAESHIVTKRDESSRNVTPRADSVTTRHTPSPGVTLAVPSGAVLSGAELLLPASAGLDLDSVYAAYPRKEGKKRGMAALRKVATTPAKLDAVRQAVANYAATVAGKERDFVKHFDTFMGCWEDYTDGAPSLLPGTAAPLPMAHQPLARLTRPA